MPMIKMLWHYVILGVVLASHVICTNTDLVHPARFADTIPGFVCPM